MRTYRVLPLVSSLMLVTLWQSSASASYRAVSLDAFEHAAQAHRSDAQAVGLGGINRILGMVVAPDGDLYIVGRHDSKVPALTRDHLAAALRAAEMQEWPLVSLDGMTDTPSTRLLKVRFEGGIASTSLGADLLRADVALKRFALGLISLDRLGVHSYLDASVASGSTNEVSTRFWFMPSDRTALRQRDGVFTIRRLAIAVKTEIRNTGAADHPAEQFAAELENALAVVASENPDIARIKPLFDLAQLAKAITEARSKEDLHFWLHEYRLTLEETPQTFDLLKNTRAMGGGRTIQVSGGISLEVLDSQIADGDLSALRDAVVFSRPTNNAFTWTVPIAAWPTDDMVPEREGPEDAAARRVISRNAGTAIYRNMLNTGTVSPPVNGVTFDLDPQPAGPLEGDVKSTILGKRPAGDAGAWQVQ